MSVPHLRLLLLVAPLTVAFRLPDESFVSNERRLMGDAGVDDSCDDRSSCDVNGTSSCDKLKSCDSCGDSCATATEDSIYSALGHTSCKVGTDLTACCLCGATACGATTNHSGRHIMKAGECPLAREFQTDDPVPQWAQLFWILVIFVGIPARLFYLHKNGGPFNEFCPGIKQKPTGAAAQPAAAAKEIEVQVKE